MFKLTKASITKLSKNPLQVLNTLSEDEVASILQQAKHSYFNEKTPLFSDQLFDLIEEYLKDKNPDHPILKFVGTVVGNERKVELPYYMGSLDKLKEVSKFAEKYPGSYIVSDKLDGNSGLLIFKDSEIKLYSRGDGTIGQDCSHLVGFIKGIPKAKNLAIRGEVIISRENFEKVKTKGANARNMVAGLLNAKIPDMEIAKLAEFVCYEVISPDMAPADQYEYLDKLGFTTVYHKIINTLSLESLSELLVDRRENSKYEVDGIVVAHNKKHTRNTTGNPSYAFAFKSVQTMAKAEVIVNNVEWNLSKHGYLIPTVLFSPVHIAGSMIKRATGFNGKFVKDNKIGPGSRLIIMKAGDVIPYIYQILTPSETGKPQMPDMKYEWTESGIDIVLTDKKDNEEFKLKNFEHFITTIKIAGLGPGNIKKLYEAGINTPKLLFSATTQQIQTIDGFKEKSATKIHAAIQDAKSKITCATLLPALNIMGRGLAGKKLELILNAFPDILKNRYIPTLSELITIKGIEKKTAELFISNIPKFFEVVDENELDCAPAESKPPVASGPNFQGTKIVFTGFRNKDLEEYIKANGGEVSGSVSKKTTLVIAKDVNEDSSKITKAKELDIKIMSLDEFIKSYNIK